MRLKKQLLLTAILFLVAVVQSYAVPAYPFPVKITQPDGSTITVVKVGNPFFHYDTTEDGVLIAKDKQGIYRYAEFNKQGNIVATLQKAQDKSERSKAEANFVKSLKTVAEAQPIIQKVKQQRIAAFHTTNERSNFPKVGSPKSLVILVNFANLDFVVDNPQEAYTQLLNEKGYSKNGGTGSARDYFIDNSMETFSPDFEVIGPYTLPNNYQYYGGNTNGKDAKPAQMIVDACKLADDAGIDFTEYDTDNDGEIDNIFVYYAGHNEAEHGGASTVWPHRWVVQPGYNYSGNVQSTTFDGKRVTDYACTSELRGSGGSIMCGIGTFVHEFGHVLGLDDMYPTGGQRHFTLGRWDVMASGPYLNNGRTPPSYSAFQRFRLGFMTPKILKNPETVFLNPINTSNEAYLISETEAHNLVGDNPNPKEFFLLENRQKTGWDRFLPGHGMLITRVKYNKYKWDRNEPNNDPTAMGVDLMEADGIGSSSTLSGDPYPGMRKITKYTPKLQSGTLLDDQPITGIKESNKIISFKYKGGKDAPAIKAEGTLTQFVVIQGESTDTKTISFFGEKIVDNITLSLKTGSHYQLKLESENDDKWRKQVVVKPTGGTVEKTVLEIRYNPTEPTCQTSHYDYLTITSKNAEEIKFRLVGNAQRQKYIEHALPPVLKVVNTTYKDIVVSWNKVKDNEKDAAGYYLTAVQKKSNGKDSVIVNNRWTTQLTDTLRGLVSNKEYEIKVKASDKNIICDYEHFSPYSEILLVKTLPYPFKEDLRCTVSNGTVRVFVPEKNNNKAVTVNVYNALGQKIFFTSTTKDVLELSNLPKNVVLIVQSGKQHKKIIIN